MREPCLHRIRGCGQYAPRWRTVERPPPPPDELEQARMPCCELPRVDCRRVLLEKPARQIASILPFPRLSNSLTSPRESYIGFMVDRYWGVLLGMITLRSSLATRSDAVRPRLGNYDR